MDRRAPDEPLSEVVKLRLTPRQRFRYEQAAAHEGVTLSEYIRRQLVTADNVVDELRALRAWLEDSKRLNETHLDSCAIETLLLLRSISDVDNLRSVHSAMKVIGVEPFHAA